MLVCRQLQKMQRKGEQMEKLKAKIDEKFPTRAAFAEAMGVDASTMSRMLANGNWKADKIETAAQLLDIPVKEIPAYFFTNAVAKNATTK